MFRKFNEPGPLSRPVPFWFLDGQLTPEESESQISEMKSQGIHAAIPLKAGGGLKHPYLSESWFQAFGDIFQAAGRHQFQVWLYDEGNCPSGSVEKRLAQKQEFQAKAIVCEPRSVWGTSSVTVPEGVLLGVSFRRSDGTWREISAWIQPEGLVIPRGEERPAAVYFFLARPHILEPGNFNSGDVDRTNPKTVESFLNLTHREYEWRFKDKFGDTITAVFTDEPAMFEQPVYAHNFREEFRRRKGYDFQPYLPSLFFDIGPITVKVRCDFYDVTSSLYAENFFGKAAEWCKEHNLTYTGHLWSEEHPDVMMTHQGDFFHIYRYMDYPGIDCISGGRAEVRKENPLVIKAASSASHLYGKKRTMCEAFAGVTQAFCYQEMKWMTDWLMVCGVDLMVPHIIYYTVSDNYWNPNMFFQNPGWPYFHLYSDYVGRVSELLQSGVHVSEVAVLYPRDSIWANTTAPQSGLKKHYVRGDGYGYFDSVPECPPAIEPIIEDLTAVVDELINEQVDLDFISAELLIQAAVEDGRLKIGDESYSTLILPRITVESVETMRKIEEFARKGGRVIAYGTLPEYASDGEDKTGKLKDIVSHLFSPAGKAVFVRDNYRKVVEAVTSRDLVIDVDFVKTRDRNIHYQHRRAGETDIYFLVNHSSRREKVQASFQVSGQPELWNPEDGHGCLLTAARQENGRTELKLNFEPYQACFIIFRKQADKTLPAWTEEFTPILQLDGEWDIEFLPNSRHRFLGQFDRLFTFQNYTEPLMSWSNLGMPCFSGRVRYTKKFLLAEKPKGSVCLDLGTVKHNAEVTLNGKPLGARVWKPYRFNAGDALQPGKNLLEVVVSNTLANLFSHPGIKKPIGYESASGFVTAERLQSGLLGPVRLYAARL
ncbi:MAG: glycosyl hydrolase [Candidatus Omnitrophota bacterium]